MTGRPPVPTALAALRGNPGHRPLNTLEPVVEDTGIPGAPRDLDDSEIEEWNRLAPILYKMGVLKSIDVDELANYCRAYVRYKDAHQSLTPETFTIVAGNGSRVANPLIRVIEQAATEMHRIRQGFGMTPAARTKITAVPPDQGKVNRFDGQKRA